jgi:hypothetical protein
MSKLWGARVKAGGHLYRDEPVRLVYDPETKMYWDEPGGLGVYGAGQEDNYGSVTFACTELEWADKWIAGVKACKLMMAKH